jgi:hypothetical protein
MKKELRMSVNQQMKPFNDFYDAAFNNDVLEPKTTLMLHLATAMAVGCMP